MSDTDQFDTAMRVMGFISLLVGGFFIAVFVFIAVFMVKVFIKLLGPGCWPTAPGRIVASDVCSRETVAGDEWVKTVGNYPHIVYEYEVAGTAYVGERLKIVVAGQEMPNHRIPETLARYPPGSVVQVRYDPTDPSSAVLEYDSVLSLLPAIVLSTALFVWVAWAFLGFPGGLRGVPAKIAQALAALIREYFPGANTGLVIETGGLGLLFGLFGAIWMWRVLLKWSWPVAPGLIVSSEVEVADVYRPFRFDVIYGYEVEGRQYRSNRIQNFSTTSNVRWIANRVVRRYPQGSTVHVRYNPKNHADSILEPGGVGALIFLLLAGGCLWIAVAALS